MMKTLRRLGALLLALTVVCAAPMATVAPAAAQQSQWRANYFPNIWLTDQDGRRLRFYDDMIKDRIVAINFIYTDCPDVCPLDTAQMRRVQQILGDRVGRDVFIYSISIDPRRDTPETLRNYMHMYDIGPGWRFLTGDPQEVENLQRRLGISPAEPGNLGSHDPSVIVGNETTGQWIKRSSYENPRNLAILLGEQLNNGRTPLATQRQDYSDAGVVADTSRGANLFRTRCISCHTIGGGDGLGPDLAGVTTARARPWLERWLREPDRVIAERDPVIMEMMPRFRNLPMPNLRLGQVETDALITYMEAETQRVRAAEANAHDATMAAQGGHHHRPR